MRLSLRLGTSKRVSCQFSFEGHRGLFLPVLIFCLGRELLCTTNLHPVIAKSISGIFMMMMMMEDETSAQRVHHSQSSPTTADDDDHPCSDPDQEKYRQSIRLARGLAAHNMKPLPEKYVLGEHDVICGRGRRCFNHIGNQRFRTMVEESLSKYAEASAKLEKTYIICEVVNQVRKNSPNGGFVKKDPVNGRYFEVGDFLAVRAPGQSPDCDTQQREKTSQAFRDALHDLYKSSNAAKKKRRISEQARKLYKQPSAPHLTTPATQISSNEFEEEREIFLPGNSYNHADFVVSNSDFVVSNSKWMRVETLQDRGFVTGESKDMNLLLGELDLNSSSHSQQCNLADKRRMFASQRSATSVVEGVQSSNFFNRSCPNLSGGHTNRPLHRPSPLVHDVIRESDGETEETSANDIHWTYAFNEWHHSTPDLFADQPGQPEYVTSDRPSLLLNRMMRKKARSERLLMNAATGNRFDLYVRPLKNARSFQAPIDHEDLVLSPIGDGNTLDLFDKLQGNEEHFESFVNPLPF
jgi:hypothetical protein